MFDRFIAAAPATVKVRALSLPMEALTYDQLADRISERLPAEPIVVIAESFSGPIAVALAERCNVTALVLCNSFVVAPRARLLRWLILPLVFKLRPSAFLLRFMVGPNADAVLLDDVVETGAALAASGQSDWRVGRDFALS